ncbi:MAG: FadR family transcriptional regulator [Deferribacteraceae bacterium]|jgi:DNA-binding FadR family transcriptional regulator|nr:FadR family transcriptional regulator [Deferribacteraceae bacterium]
MLTEKLSEITEKRLIEYIKEHGLKAGERLPNESDLSKLLGVGRGTIREAVRMLAGRNVLDVRHGSGTFVAADKIGVGDDPLGFTFIDDKKQLTFDLMEIRMMIEPRIASMAALMADEEQIAEIKALAKAVEMQIHNDVNHINTDILFHSKIAESTGNLVIPNLMPIIQQAIVMFINVTDRDLKQETIETHRAIVDSIEARDPIGASDAMMLHLIYNRNRIKKIFADQ